MTQAVLFSLVIAITGIYAIRWTVRLAPLTSELPSKTIIATVLAGLVVAGGVSSLQTPEALRWIALVAAPIYVLAPLASLGLARSRRYGVGDALVRVLYWTRPGRAGLRRLIAQVALQQGDARAALDLVERFPDDAPLMRAQALALQGAWDDVLDLRLPREGDNAFLGDAARIEAMLGRGEVERAERELEEVERRFDRSSGGPIGYRSVQLSKARVAAAQGDFETARDALQTPMVGVPPHLVFHILSRAADAAGRHEAAGKLATQAYALAPAALRERYGERVDAHGLERPAPAARGRRPLGTYALLGVLAVAFGAQLWLDGSFGTPQGAAPSTLVAAWLQGFGGVPDVGAWWRYLSYAFVHGNLVHIAFNVWVLFDIGRIYEARRGWGNLLAAFALGTAAGAYLTLVAQSGQPVALVGASGGVLGIAGALLADALRSRRPQDRQLRRSLLQWMALIALLSLAVPNVSLWGHVGGVLGGAAWGFARQGLPSSGLFDRAVGVAAAVLLAASAAQAALLAMRLF